MKAMINRMKKKIKECNDSGDYIVAIDEQPHDIIYCDVNDDPAVAQRQNEKQIKKITGDGDLWCLYKNHIKVLGDLIYWMT